MGDHTETFEVDFDPTVLSYEQLLKVFWESHNPTLGQSYGGRQYISLLLYHNERQKELAEKTKQNIQQLLQRDIQTEITSYSKFYLAEDYHQKYYLKRYKNAVAVVNELFETEEAFTNATLTARLNGLVNGYLTMEQLNTEIDAWNIHVDHAKVLKELLDKIRW